MPFNPNEPEVPTPAGARPEVADSSQPAKWDVPYEQVEVLDHGFVILRNISGPTRRQDVWESDDGPNDSMVWACKEQYYFDADDTDPANTARMSSIRLTKHASGSWTLNCATT